MDKRTQARVDKIVRAIELLGEDHSSAAECEKEYFKVAEKLAAEIVRLRAMLKQLERSNGGGCSWCRCWPHEAGCELATLLEE